MGDKAGEEGSGHVTFRTSAAAVAAVEANRIGKGAMGGVMAEMVCKTEYFCFMLLCCLVAACATFLLLIWAAGRVLRYRLQHAACIDCLRLQGVHGM